MPNENEEVELTEEEQYEAEREAAFYEQTGATPPPPEEDPEEEEDETTEEEVQAEESDQPEAEADDEDEPLEEDDQTEDENEDPDPEDKPKMKIKWNGEDVEVTHEEAIALAQKGFDYTAKMQNISKYRKDLEAAGLDDHRMDLLRRANAGDKSAAAEYLNSLEIDPLDLIDAEMPENESNPPRKTDDGYVISEQVRPLMEQVMSNRQLQSKMERAEAYLPQAVIRSMAQDPDLLYGAIGEVESGSFDQVMPRVQARLATLSELDREYALNSPEVFGNIYFEEKSKIGGTQMEEAAPAAKPAAPAAKKKPNMASVGIKKSNTGTNKKAVIKDAFNDDDEYQRLLNKVQNSR